MRFGNALIIPEISTPATPAAGTHALYSKSDGKIYQKDPSGTESLVVVASGIDDSMVAVVTPNTQSGTTYTPVAGDANLTVLFTSATAVAVTLPTNASVPYTIGTSLQFVQMGAGQVTTAAGAGGTLHAPHGAKTAEQYAIVNLLKVGTDEWIIAGDTSV